MVSGLLREYLERRMRSTEISHPLHVHIQGREETTNNIEVLWDYFTSHKKHLGRQILALTPYPVGYCGSEPLLRGQDQASFNSNSTYLDSVEMSLYGSR